MLHLKVQQHVVQRQENIWNILKKYQNERKPDFLRFAVRFIGRISVIKKCFEVIKIDRKQPVDYRKEKKLDKIHPVKQFELDRPDLIFLNQDLTFLGYDLCDVFSVLDSFGLERIGSHDRWLTERACLLVDITCHADWACGSLNQRLWGDVGRSLEASLGFGKEVWDDPNAGNHKNN